MHLTTSRVAVDEEGWRELSKLLADTWSEVEKIQRESGKRLRDGGEDQISAGVVAMLFERPEGGAPEDDGSNSSRGKKRETASAGRR
jgi:hypothetical protein